MNQKVFTSEVSSTQLWNRALVYRLLVWFLVVLALGLMASCGQNPIDDKPQSELLLAVEKLETKFECGREEQHKVITKGFLDMFDVVVDPSTTTTLPDSNLDTWFNSVILGTNNYQGQQTLAGYDGQFVNQFFGETFSGLPSNITKAFFITGVRGIGEIQNNDGLTIGEVGTNNTLGSPIVDLTNSTVWITDTLSSNGEIVAAIEINQTSAAFTPLGSSQKLDVVVQDDTSVDFTRLHVCYKKKERFDLSIEKSLEGDTLTIGSQSTYNIQVTNSGPSAANSTANSPIIITDTLPVGISWDDNSPPNWSCTLQSSNPDVVECIYTGPPIPPNGPNNFVTLSLTVEVTADADDIAKNCAQVSAAGDTVDSNNESCIKNPVSTPSRSDLSIRKRLEGETLTVGSHANYIIDVINNGPDPDNGPIIVTDTLPTGVDFVSASSGWSCPPPYTPVVVCEYNGPYPINPGDIITLVLEVDVTNEVQGNIVKNCATVDSPSNFNPQNDEACTKNPVEFCLDISTGSIDSNTPLNIGDLDYDWIITLSPPNANVASETFVTEYAPNLTWKASHSPHSEWIMPYDPTNPPDIANWHTWVLVPDLYIYQRTFSIPSGFSTCTLDVARHASDNGSKLKLDGTVISDLPANGANSFQVGTSTSATFSPSGTHTLIAEVTNNETITGLLVEAKVTCY